LAASKQQINWKEVKKSIRKLGNEPPLSKGRFIKNIISPSLSHDRRIKIETSKHAVH